LLVFSQEFIEVFSLSNGEKLENVSLHGVVAVDTIANLLCAHDHIYSLRYVGERINEEITDENVVVDTPSNVFGNSPFVFCRFFVLVLTHTVTAPGAGKSAEKGSWSRSDSLFLKDAIAGME